MAARPSVGRWRCGVLWGVDSRHVACLRRQGLFIHAMLIGLGMGGIILGFWGSARLPQPYDALVAWCAPVGLLAALAGITWVIIPNFFG